jgi:hypothetical protein
LQKISRTHLSVLVINHDVVRLHVSVHYSFTVTEIEGLVLDQYNGALLFITTYLKELIYVEPDIVIDKFRVEATEIGIIHVFEY